MPTGEGTGQFTSNYTGSTGTLVGNAPVIDSVLANTSSTTVTVTFNRGIYAESGLLSDGISCRRSIDGGSNFNTSANATISDASDAKNGIIIYETGITFAENDFVQMEYSASSGDISSTVNSISMKDNIGNYTIPVDTGETYTGNLFNLDFVGPHNTPAIGDNAWTPLGEKSSLFDAVNVYPGTAGACRIVCTAGAVGGDGAGGGSHNVNVPIPNGTWTYHAINFWLPGDWLFSNLGLGGGGSSVKWHKISNSSNHGIFINMKANMLPLIDAAEIVPGWKTYFPSGVTENWGSTVRRGGNKNDPANWNYYEIHVKHHTSDGEILIFQDSGTNRKERLVWKLSDYASNVPTSEADSLTLNNFKFITYWNGGVPQSQNCWLAPARWGTNAPDASVKDESGVYNIIGKG